MQFAGSFDFLSYGSITRQVTQYPCLSHNVFWIAFQLTKGILQLVSFST